MLIPVNLVSGRDLTSKYCKSVRRTFSPCLLRCCQSQMDYGKFKSNPLKYVCAGLKILIPYLRLGFLYISSFLNLRSFNQC